MIYNPNAPRLRGGVAKKPILRSEIVEAQRHTNSNRAAAKYLGVDYRRYRKYAMLYKLFDSHANPLGLGTTKGFGKRPTSIPLRDILAGKHPQYNLSKLKNRLVARKKLPECCALCGFNERRITDNKVPLIITFKDGNKKNFSLDNLVLYCYNCMFLTSGGVPLTLNPNLIPRSFSKPHTIPGSHDIAPVHADSIDEEDLLNADIELTDEERDQLLDEGRSF